MSTRPDVSEIDLQMMARALTEAQRGKPSPNPHVGAVITKNDEVIALGHHERAGQPHAEIVALGTAGEAAKDATLYVTLEPCNHEGQTPPCVDAILQAGISRVVVGCRDPNPHVQGGGIEVLQAAGLQVDVGVLGTQAQALIEPWNKFITTGLPYVRLKLGMSLDGRIATRTGTAKWITGPEARAKGHALRAASDAIMVGVGTVLVDDPQLTVRDVPGISPIRVVMDTTLRIPLSSSLVATATQVPTWVITAMEASEAQENALLDQGVHVFRVPRFGEGRVDIAASLRVLGQHGIVQLMVEGGAELAGSMLNAAFVDELHVFTSPMMLGPRGRPGAVDWAGPATPAEAPKILEPQWEVCGRDAYVHGPLVYPSPAR